MSDEGNPFQSPGLEGVRGGCTSDSFVEFDYVLDDTVWFSLRENLSQHAALMRRTRIGSAIASIFFASACLTSLFGPDVLLLIVGLPFFFLALLFGYRAWNTSRSFEKNSREQLRRMLASRKNHGVYGWCSVKLEEEGVITERPGGHSFWRWWAVPAIDIAEPYLLIYTSSMEACLVPSRAFASEAHFNAFAANAMQLWKAKKRANDETA